MERNAFLARTPLFSGVASQEVGAMLDCLDAHERRYAQGERIHHMGDAVSTAGIVLTGRVRIEHVDPWGNVSVVGIDVYKRQPPDGCGGHPDAGRCGR